jgi:hypothetical protein
MAEELRVELSKLLRKAKLEGDADFLKSPTPARYSEPLPRPENGRGHC